MNQNIPQHPTPKPSAPKPDIPRANIPQPNIPRFGGDDSERVKMWWHSHGKSITAGLALGLFAIFGFNYWQDYQKNLADDSSELFEQLRGQMIAFAENEGGENAGEDVDAGADENAGENAGEQVEVSIDSRHETLIETIANELMQDFSSTQYAVHAALALAKTKQDNGKLDQAATALRWVIENANDEMMEHIGRLDWRKFYWHKINRRRQWIF